MIRRATFEVVIAAAAFAVLAGAHFYLGNKTVRAFSPTYDEPVHLTAGYVYWKTADYRMNGFGHPPFGEMWAAVPLLFMKPFVPAQHPAWLRHEWGPSDQYGFADAFLYHNRVSAEDMLAAGRRMQIVLSILAGVLIVGAAAGVGGGLWPALFAAVFWAFSPTFLASGTVVATDLAFAVFLFGFFLSLIRLDSMRSAALGGISLGLCLASKFFALVLGPMLLALAVYYFATGRRKPFAYLKAAALLSVSAFIALAVVYRFNGLEVFWGGIKHGLALSQQGRSSFFWGRHGTQGWPLYFPFAFAVKTPVPWLIALALSCALVLRRKLTFPAPLWIPPLVFFAVACTLKVQIGHRHLLAVYPFLCVIIAVGLDRFVGNRKWMAAPLLLWAAIGTWRASPHFIGYFNEFVGGPSHGYEYLTDSNVDWGQGLKQLGESLSAEDRAKGIYLTYFGVADPRAYGIRYLDVGSDRIVPRTDDAALGIRPTTYAISVTNLQCTYYANTQAFDWLKKRRPARTVANSIFVYDFSSDPEALETLERLRS